MRQPSLWRANMSRTMTIARSEELLGLLWIAEHSSGVRRNKSRPMITTWRESERK